MTRLSFLQLRKLAIVAACAAVSACAASGGGGPQLTTDSRLHVAEAAAASGNKDLAVRMYGEAATADPANNVLQAQAATAIAKLGQIDLARSLIEHDLKARPGNPVLLHAAAHMAIEAGDTKQALAIYDRLLANNPGDVNAKVDKAVALDLIGRHDLAQPLYREALQVRAGDPVIANDLAMSLMLQGHVHEATAVLAPVANDENSPGRARDNLGLLYALDGNTAQAHALIGDRLTDNDVARIAQAVGGSAANTAPPPPLAVVPSAAIPVAAAAMPPALIPGTAVALAPTAPMVEAPAAAPVALPALPLPPDMGLPPRGAEADGRAAPAEERPVTERRPVEHVAPHVWHVAEHAKPRVVSHWHPKRPARWHAKKPLHPPAAPGTVQTVGGDG
jgi:Flp pilus assembly protein TadD